MESPGLARLTWTQNRSRQVISIIDNITNGNLKGSLQKVGNSPFNLKVKYIFPSSSLGHDTLKIQKGDIKKTPFNFLIKFCPCQGLTKPGETRLKWEKMRIIFIVLCELTQSNVLYKYRSINNYECKQNTLLIHL